MRNDIFVSEDELKHNDCKGTNYTDDKEHGVHMCSLSIICAISSGKPTKHRCYYSKKRRACKPGSVYLARFHMLGMVIISLDAILLSHSSGLPAIFAALRSMDGQSIAV